MTLYATLYTSKPVRIEVIENKQKSGFGYGTAKIEKAFTPHTDASSIQLWPLIRANYG